MRPVGKEDDLQSVTSQSSTADSDTASDRTDLSNGHLPSSHPYPTQSTTKIPSQPEKIAPEPEKRPAGSGSEFDALFTSAKSANSRSGTMRRPAAQQEDNAAAPTAASASKVGEEISGKRTVASRTAAKKAAIGLALSAALSPPSAKSRSPSPLPTRTRVHSPVIPDLPEPEVRSAPVRKLLIQRKAPQLPPPVPPVDLKSSDDVAKCDIPPPASSENIIGTTGKQAVRRKALAKRTAEPPLPPRPPSPLVDDLELDMPKRVIPVQRREAAAAKQTVTAASGTTYKKKIFKSRSARVVAVAEPESVKSDPAAGDMFEDEAETAVGRYSPEPPRVPPISKHFVELGSRSGGGGSHAENLSTVVQVKPPSAKVS